MNTGERIGKIEKRVNTIEKAVQILTELIVSHDERLVKTLNNDEDLNAKISALVDAQIRSEDKLQALIDTQMRNEDRLQIINSALGQLTQLVEKAHSRIDRLEN